MALKGNEVVLLVRSLPTKRLVANFDNDVPEYWEWSGEGLFPFDASNEAYKLGVNYVIYGLTH